MAVVALACRRCFNAYLLSNRLYRDNTTTNAKDEYYTYDGINRR